MAIPADFPGEEEATTPPLDHVASATGTAVAATVIAAGTTTTLGASPDGTNVTVTVCGAGTAATLAATAADTTTTLTVLAAGTNAAFAASDVGTNTTLSTPAASAIASLTISAVGTATTLTTTTAGGHTGVPGAIVSQPYVNSASLHDLGSQEHMAGAQQVLTFNEFPIECHNAVTQESPREPRESPVQEAHAAVVPTPLHAIPRLNKIRDRSRGITERTSNIGASLLSSSSEDYESSSSEEGAVGGVSKKCVRSVKKNSKDHHFLGKTVDHSSVTCNICMERFCDCACLPCGHLGCHPCIKKWLDSSIPPKSCHMCRQNVKSVHTVVFCDFSCETCFTN